MIGFCAWIKGYCTVDSLLAEPQLETFTDGTNMTSVYLSSGLMNSKGADQSAHPQSLISAFVFRSFESIISRLSVAKETGLFLALSKISKTGLFASRA